MRTRENLLRLLRREDFSEREEQKGGRVDKGGAK